MNNVISMAIRKASSRLTTAVMATVSMILTPVTFAQEQGTEEELTEITVTGSRIDRSTFDTPTPIDVISEEEIRLSGFNNVGDILQRAPSVGVGVGATNTWYQNNSGASFINLRSLGVDRTLVLVNGRRRVSGSQTSSAVDLTTIPAGMIENIEVITGGASAVYGADAVSGVINVKLRDDYEGLEFSARTGMNKDGNARATTVGAFGGMSFNDGRGSVTLGLNYNDEEPLFKRDAGFVLPTLRFRANPADTGPNDGIPDQITEMDWHVPLASYGGSFFSPDFSEVFVIDDQGGLLRASEFCDVYTGSISYQCNPSVGYNPVDFEVLRHEQEIASTMLNIKYDLNDNLRLYTEASYARTKTADNRIGTVTIFTPLIFRENPFLPTSVANYMDSEGLGVIALSRSNNDHGIQVARFKRDTYTVVAGLEGEFLDGWDWQVSYQYGKYEVAQRTNTHVTPRFLAAADAISDPVTGEPICRDPAARAEGCVPLNMFGPTSADPAAVAYIAHTRMLDVDNTQTVFSGLLTGDLVELPAGPLGVAIGAEYREERLKAMDDPISAAGLVYTDDVGGPPIDAEFDVGEIFIEAVAPLVANAPFAEELSIEGAVRYSDYNTIGDTTAWKFAGIWAPVEDIRFRATRSQSVRAPSLAELFNPGTQSPTGLNDPCDAAFINNGSPNRPANCQALGLPFEGWVDNTLIGRQIFSGGNPNLSEETSDSVTVGVILTPRFVEGLRIAVDFWDIEIEDAIGSIGLTDILERCVDLDTIDNQFCAQITRQPDFSILRVDISEINIGKLEASGVDFNVFYQLDLSNADLSFSLGGTYLSKLEELVDATNAETLIIRNGEFNSPDLRMNLATSYNRGPLSATWNMRYISSAEADVQRLTDEVADILGVGSQIYHDVTATYEINDTYSVFGGINNAFDTAPPRHPETQDGRAAPLYDNIGRFFFVGATVRFQ